MYTEQQPNITDTAQHVENDQSKIRLQNSWDKYIQENGAPTATVIEVTNFCPNNCAHCYANLSFGKNTTQMPPETFSNCLDIVSSHPDQKPEQIWLVGGEPTVHPLLKKFLQETKNRGFQAMIVTTGETFAGLKYSQDIVPLADEIDITIRGFGALHDLMMLPKANEIFSTIPPQLSLQEQINFATNLAKEKGLSINKHFSKTIEGLVNIAQIKKTTGAETAIGLNVDMQAMTDLYQIIQLLNQKNIPVSNLILQIQTFSENNSNLAEILPNIWRKPTTNMVETYYRQATYLIDKGLFNGNIEIIDQLPQPIIEELKSREINLGQFYHPVATPAIGPNCKFRPNVVLEKIN